MHVNNCYILQGIIASGSGNINLKSLDKALRKAFISIPKAVALVINSPGGSPVQSSLIGARVRYLANKYKVEVVAFVEDYAASGGYWLACSADTIYADKSSIVGSIGVITSLFVRKLSQ